MTTLNTNFLEYLRPPTVTNMVNNDTKLIEIPPDIRQKILPNENLSILDFLQFSLPVVARTPITNGQQYFSTLTPTITIIEEIKFIPTPPLTILDDLVKRPEASFSQSVLCLHAPGLAGKRLPMWILSYWVEVTRIRPLKVKWGGAEENLQALKISKSCTDKTRVLILQVYNELACLSWSGDIKGFFATISTDHLSTYLTKKWLSDEHENQLLYLLRQQVWRRRGEDGIDVTDTYFIKRLTEIEEDEYATHPGYAWIRKKGQELATGVQDMLITIANVNNNHWVAVVVDFKESNIQYGDSMGGTIDGDLEAVLIWWIHHHTGRTFTTSYLPITRQQDGHSCGILAWNALVVHLFPMENPLADVRAVADERLKAFLQISHRHNEKVCPTAFINSTLLT